MVVYWFACWNTNREVRVQIPARAEIWYDIIASPAPPSQLSYDEYAESTLPGKDEMSRERAAHPPSYTVAIGVNPGGLGVATSQILRWGSWGLHEILLYIV